MTQSQFGNEICDVGTCVKCSHLQHRHELNRGGTFGVCTNAESDHFGHIITSYHPVCGKQH